MIALVLALFQEPEKVTVGIYVNQITKLSLKENSYSVDFWIWFRWRRDDLKPYESFEVSNGAIERMELATVKKLGDVNYAYRRVVATITKYWDVSRYPLDNHRLDVIIEDKDDEEHKLVYLSDQENCNFDPDLKVPGWTLSRVLTNIGTSTHRSNFGDTTLPTGKESRYSSFTFSVHLERRGYEYFVKLFVGLLIAAFIAFLAFFIRPTDLDPRFGLGIGAIFAAVASEYVISSSLPDTSVLTLADKLHIVAFAAIFLALAESVWSLRLCESGREELSRRLDRMSVVVLPVLYLAATAFVVVRA